MVTYNPPSTKNFIDGAMVAVFDAAATSPVEAAFSFGQPLGSPLVGQTILNLGLAFATVPTFATQYGALSQIDFLNSINTNLTGGPMVTGEQTAFLNEFTRLSNPAFGFTALQIKAIVAAEITADTLGVVADASLGLPPADLATFQQQQQAALNRTNVSGAYANATATSPFLIPTTVSPSDPAWVASQTVLQGVTSAPGTVTTADNQITAAVAAGNTSPIIGQGGGGTPVFLTVNQDNVTGGNVAITGIFDTTPAPAPNQTTLQLFDNISPFGTNNSLNIITTGPLAAILSAANVPALNDVQKVTIQPNSPLPVTFDPTGIAAALTTVGQNGGVAGSNVSFNQINGLQTNNITLSNMTAGAQFFQVNTVAGLTGNHTVNLTLNNVRGPVPGVNPIVQIVGAVANDGFNTVAIDSIGATPNFLNTLFVAAGGPNLTHLNIDGTQHLTIDNPILFKAGSPVNVQVAATDTGGVKLDVTGNAAPVTFNDAGTGPDSIRVDAGELNSAATSLTGSTSGHNILSVTEVLLTAATPAQELASINGATNFQTLQMSGATATIDITKITNVAYTDIDFATPGAVTVTNNNSTIHLSDISGFALGAVNITNAAGQTTLNYDLASSAVAGATDAGVTLAGVSTIHLTSNGTVANTFGGGAGITVPGPVSVTVDGNDALTLGQFLPNVNTSGETVSTLATYTGNLTYTTSGHGDTVNVGGTGALFVNLSTPVLVGGVFNGDQITLNAASGSADQIRVDLASNIGDVNAQGFETVTNFVAGQDHYQATALSTVAANHFFNAGNIVSATLVGAANTAFANGIAATALANATAHQVVQFSYNGSTYDFIEQSGTNVYTPGVLVGQHDVLVKEAALVGTHTTHDFLLS